MSDIRYTIVIPNPEKPEDKAYLDVYAAPKVPAVGDKLIINNQIVYVRDVVFDVQQGTLYVWINT